MSELRAAAERVRRIAMCEAMHYVYSDRPRKIGESMVGLYERDKSLLADAYLALVPADSDEPVTREWVASLPGFTVDRFDDSWFCRRVNDSFTLNIRVDGRCSVEETDGGEGDVLLIEADEGSPATRGQLRALCAALGIPLEGK